MAPWTKVEDVSGNEEEWQKLLMCFSIMLVSTGLRYRTNPSSSSTTTPINVTYTLNPIVGHMTTAYVAQVSENLSMCSRFEFSIYSYESDLAVGFEYQAKNANVTLPKPSSKAVTTGDQRSSIEDNISTTENDKSTATTTKTLEGLMKVRLGFASVRSVTRKERDTELMILLYCVGFGADVGRAVQEHFV
jgi:hypothetical protein